MKTTLGILFAWAGQLLLVVVCDLRSSPPTVEELERRAITYRVENIKQGYVQMHVIDEEPPPRQSERLYEITFDGNQRVRQMRRCRLLGKPEWGKPEKIVVTPDIYIMDDEFTPTPTAIDIAPAKTYKFPREKLRILNVQALGMDLGGADFLHKAHVESLLNRPDRSAPVIHPELRGNVETWKLDYKIKHPQQKLGVDVSVWIAPSQGFSIVGIESNRDMNGKRYKRTINSDMKQYPEGGIWYPAKVVMTETTNDRVSRRQVILIEDARFGGSIDETAFTLAGLDLKSGREIGDSTSGQPWAKVWDGKEAVDPSGVQTATRPNPDRRRWLMWISASGLALMAVYYFWRGIRHRRPTAGSSA